MSKYSFSEDDFKNLEGNFPESFFHLDYVKAKREAVELREYCNRINKELNKLKEEKEQSS